MLNAIKLNFALLSVSWLQRASWQSLWTPENQRVRHEKFQFLHHPFKDSLFPHSLVKSGLVTLLLIKPGQVAQCFMFAYSTMTSSLYTTDTLNADYTISAFWLICRELLDKLYTLLFLFCFFCLFFYTSMWCFIFAILAVDFNIYALTFGIIDFKSSFGNHMLQIIFERL